MWIDQFGDQLAAYLASYNTGVLSAAGVAPLPVRYRSHHLAVECLVPGWADIISVLSQQPAVVLIVPAPADTARWLQYQGEAQIAATPDLLGWLWAGITPQQAHTDYLVVELRPQRLDLFDQRRGWGARETLELVVDTHAQSK